MGKGWKTSAETDEAALTGRFIRAGSELQFNPEKERLKKRDST